MIGVQYGNGSVRYIVDNGSCVTVGRLNSLAKAKSLVGTMTDWKIYDTHINASVSSDDSKDSFSFFVKYPEEYPHMNKCAKLFARFKKSGCKPVA